MEKILLITNDANLKSACSSAFLENNYKFEVANDRHQIDFIVSKFSKLIGFAVVDLICCVAIIFKYIYIFIKWIVFF